MNSIKWKPSMFNNYYHLDDSYYIIYNMLTLGAIRVTKDLFKQITNYNNRLENEYMDYLKKQKFIVPLDLDEKEYLMKVFHEKNRITNNLDVVICTTTACNMRCIYCYEEGIKKVNLTPEVIKQITVWLEKYIIKYKIESLGILLFGGEPLIAKNVTVDLMDEINKMARSHCIYCYYNIGTNGTLLNRRNIQELKKLGLIAAQVTIDGPPEVHNKRRPWISGEDSFSVIIENIKKVSDLIDITIKLNIDRKNLSHINEILTILEDNNLKEKIDLKIEAIATTPASRNKGEHYCSINAFEPQKSEIALAYLQVMDLAELRGFKVHRSTAHTTPCMFVSEFGFALDAEGFIYKCISAIGIEEFKIGHVTSEEYLSLQQESMGFIELSRKCLEEGCPFVPKCGSGCPYNSFCYDHELLKMNCKKEFLETFYTNYFVSLYNKKY